MEAALYVFQHLARTTRDCVMSSTGNIRSMCMTAPLDRCRCCYTCIYIYIYTYTSRKDAQRAATAAVRTMASDYTCRYAHPHLWPSNFFRFRTRITSPIQWINECNECNAMSKRKPQCKWPHNSILHIARAIRPCLCMFSFTKLQIVVVSFVRRTKFETFCICTQQVEKINIVVCIESSLCTAAVVVSQFEFHLPLNDNTK